MDEKRKAVATDILNYCKENNLRFYTTRYEKNNIMNTRNGKTYNVYELAGGVRWLLENKKFNKVSKRRYEITTYDVEGMEKL